MIGVVLAAAIELFGGIHAADESGLHLRGASPVKCASCVSGFDAQLSRDVIDFIVPSALVGDAEENEPSVESFIWNGGRLIAGMPELPARVVRDDLLCRSHLIRAGCSKIGGIFRASLPEERKTQFEMTSDVDGWRLANVRHLVAKEQIAPSGTVHHFSSDLTIPVEEGSGLLNVESPLIYVRLLGSACRFDCGFVSLDHEEQRASNEERTYPRRYSLPLGIERHSLRGIIHTALGDKVIYLVLAAFGLAALAGIGLGLILDNFNTDRRIKRLGWCLLIFCAPLGAVTLLLGLP